MALLVTVSVAVVDRCYEGTNYWSGKKTGVKQTCEKNTSYCYTLMGSSASSPSSTRGCAPKYIDEYCDVSFLTFRLLFYHFK